ncbi:SGNH hydrolase-type esterase domain-containing protein [Xylariaceae sp. FL0016]|nr:SGNH hydrolase-type esterase domain-containing protein [Xylariaceae sp. FL0016]
MFYLGISRFLLLPVLVLDVAHAAQGLYEQCGGMGWSGDTACASDAGCQVVNAYYAQCIPRTEAGTTTTSGVLEKPATAALASAAAVAVYLAGDSTMAKNGGGSGTDGWGQYLQYSLPSSHVVSNKAIGGRSARSYTREGRFQAIAEVVKAGDWVVIEFGHNDGGSLGANDNGRTDCFGDGAQTCSTTYNGASETVLTYPAYYENAARLFLDKGAKVIMSSPTPNNICESGSCSWGPYRFDYYAWLAAKQVGGTAAGVYFVPHGQYASQAMISLGAATVNAHYPNDHTHTDPYMANVMAGSFVLGLKCGTSALGQAVKNSTTSLTTSFYGSCAKFNSTIPV